MSGQQYCKFSQDFCLQTTHDLLGCNWERQKFPPIKAIIWAGTLYLLTKLRYLRRKWPQTNKQKITNMTFMIIFLKGKVSLFFFRQITKPNATTHHWWVTDELHHEYGIPIPHLLWEDIFNADAFAVTNLFHLFHCATLPSQYSQLLFFACNKWKLIAHHQYFLSLITFTLTIAFCLRFRVSR